MKWLGSDPSYTRWLPLAFSPQVSSQPFRTANSANLPQPWGNMTCIYGIHTEQEAHQDLTGGGIYYMNLTLAGGPPLGTPLASLVQGSTTMDTVVVDTNGDRIHISNPPPPPGGPIPVSAVIRTGHTDVFADIMGLNTGTSSAVTLANAGPPGSMKQRGNYKYVFADTRLTSIEDTFGNKQTFTYGTNPGSPYLTVSDLTSGRQLFFYLGTGGYIDHVVAPYYGGSSPATTTRLDYDGTGHMTACRVYFENGTTSPVHEDTYAYSGDQVVSSSNGGDVQTSTFVSAPSKDAFGFDIWRVATTTYGDSGDNTSSDDGYGVDGTFGYSYTNETNAGGLVIGHTTTFTDARYATGKLTTWYSSIYDSTNTGYFKMSDLVLPPFVGAIDPATSNPSTDAKFRTVYQPNINNPTAVTDIDPLGNFWQMTMSNGLPLTIADPLFDTTTMTWGGPSGSDLLTLTDPTNLTWTFGYTTTGGRVNQVTDPSSTVVSTATYNAYGQLATETVPSGASSSGLAETTSYTYDGTTGDLTQLEEPHGAKSVVGVVNPATHALVPGTSYDPLGDPLALSVFPDTGDPATSATPLTTQLMWSASQDLTGATLPNGLRLVNTFTNGRRTKVQTLDPASNILGETNYSYDTRGRLYEVSDLAGIVAKYRYDKNSNLTQVIDGRGNSSYAQYGQNNEPTGTSSDGSSASDSIVYDQAGRVRESTDRRGVVFDYSYDAAGRLTGVTIPSQTSNSATYSYDAAGRPLSISRANGDSIVYSYSGANKWLTSVTTTVGSRVHTVSYTYNGNGTRSSMTSAVGSLSRTTGYQWDKAGRLVSETTTGFGTTNWTYDFAGRMLSQITTTPTSAHIGTVYTWGTSGLTGDPSTAPAYLSRMTNTVNGADTVHWDMTYSLLGQVKSIAGLRSNGDTISAAYTYDGRGRLTGETRAHTVNSTPYSGTSSYTYDLADNLNAGGNGWTYDADNHLTSAPAVGGLPGATGLSYDAAGNRTTIDGKTLSYNALGQLSSVAVPGKGTVTITNDPAGRRFTSTDVNGVTTYSDYDGNQLIGQQIGTGTGSTYADIFDGIGVGLGGTLQYTTSGPDGFNDALYLPNGMRQALDQSQRDGFGHRQEVPTGAPEVMGFDGSIGNGLRYNPGTGGYIDPNGDEQDDGIGAYRNALGNFWGGVNKLNGLGKAGLMMAANANLLYNLNTALTGKNPDGKKANKLDRGLAWLGVLGPALGAMAHDAEIMGAFHSPGDGGGGVGRPPYNEFDIVPYKSKQPGMQVHHGVMDVWAKNNIPGYVSREPNAPGIALTLPRHDATRGAYQTWTTGRGKIDWTKISPREAQEISEIMFDAAGVPQWARRDYYRKFHIYIYGLR